MTSTPHYNYGLLWRAIAISLLLHVLLLLQPGIDGHASPTTARQTLMALLRTKVESPPVAAQVVQSSSHVTASHKYPLPAKPFDSTSEPLSQVNATDTIALIEVNRYASDVTKEKNATPGVASDGNISILDFDEDKKSYLFAIAAEARRVKKYPQRAFAAGWTGTAEIRIAVATGGDALPPTLQRSSGYADIDNAALSFVGLALKRTPVPQVLRGRAFELTLPVSFSINDE